jgi:HTH-type transcriptional regulator/antitoxin HipB
MDQLARTPAQFGYVIRRARKRAAMAQGQLGQRPGLRRGTVSQIETGNATARLETILALLAALALELRVADRAKPDATEREDLF